MKTLMEALLLAGERKKNKEEIIMSNIPTPHINAPAGAFADTVLMPGDPLRSKFVADNYLENAELVNNVRGVQGYTGFYQGRRISVMASGMGCPSIGIYSYELFSFYDVKNIIRIGSIGAMKPELHLKDLIVGISAYTDSGYARNFGFEGNLAPCCSVDLLLKAVQQAEKLGLTLHCGPIYSSDVFYSANNNTQILQGLGVLGVEMEAAALYLNAARTGKNALCICSVSDNIVTGELMPAEDRQVGFRSMMELALTIA